MIKSKRKRIENEMGMSLFEMCERKHVTRTTINNWYDRGVLREMLDSNLRRKASVCKYRRVYGKPISEIADELYCSTSDVSVLHRFGYLHQEFARRSRPSGAGQGL